MTSVVERVRRPPALRMGLLHRTRRADHQPGRSAVHGAMWELRLRSWARRPMLRQSSVLEGIRIWTTFWLGAAWCWSFSPSRAYAFGRLGSSGVHAEETPPRCWLRSARQPIEETLARPSAIRRGKRSACGEGDSARNRRDVAALTSPVSMDRNGLRWRAHQSSGVPSPVAAASDGLPTRSPDADQETSTGCPVT